VELFQALELRARGDHFLHDRAVEGGELRGFFTAVTAVLYAVWIIYKTLRYGDPVAGYPSLVTIVLLLGGLQLMTLGIIGEYMGRMFNETKQRPLYLVEKFLEAGEDNPAKPRERRGDERPASPEVGRRTGELVR